LHSSSLNNVFNSPDLKKPKQDKLSDITDDIRKPKVMKLPDITVKISNVKTLNTFPGEKGKIKLIVTNQGSKSFTGPLDIDLYASTDSLLDLPLNQGNLEGKDELLGSLKYAKINLAPGQSEKFTVRFADSKVRTPSVVAPGDYYLIAKVDPNNAVAEVNESNNQASEVFSVAGTDAVISWNAIALNIIQNTSTPTLIASRNLAMVHAAIYDAANAIYRTHKSYAVNINPSEVGSASPEAAVIQAAYETLLSLYPAQKNLLDEKRVKTLVEVPNSEAKDAGIGLGKRVADQIIALRSNDGSDKANIPAYSLEPEVGVWRPTPPKLANASFPNWGLVTPFAIPSGSTFRPEGFPELNSAEYVTEFNEVKDLGEKNSTVRTADQTEIAKFWSFGRPDTFSTPGQWNRIAETVALQQNNTLEENARLFALMNIGLADAGIAAYDAKYAFNRWRPITAIREADIDGNVNTVSDVGWDSLLNTPSHPDYLAAHSVFGGAASEILTDFFGGDVSFTTTSQELPGVSRSYLSFGQAAQESSDSRIYGGVHFRSAAQDGLTTGMAVGDFISQNFLV
jgi:CARDB/PAP2 superfamily